MRARFAESFINHVRGLQILLEPEDENERLLLVEFVKQVKSGQLRLHGYGSRSGVNGYTDMNFGPVSE